MIYFIFYFTGLITGLLIAVVLLLIEIQFKDYGTDITGPSLTEKIAKRVIDKKRKDSVAIIEAPTEEQEAADNILARNDAEGKDTRIDELV